MLTRIFSRLSSICDAKYKVVHCDTPTGALNSEAVRVIGEVCSKTEALFYVDVVSSAGAVPVDIPGLNVDIGKIPQQARAMKAMTP